MNIRSAISSLFYLCFLLQVTIIHAQKPEISVTLFRDSAFGAVWSRHDSNLVAYNAMQPNGYFGIYLANINSANHRINERCLTCDNPSLPGKNKGAPDFQSTGKYIVFIAEKANHPGSSANSVPGIGTYSDIWVLTLDGKKATQLTHTPNSRDSASGIIFSIFSPDGKKLSWTEMIGKVNIWKGRQQFGSWVIKTANFIDDSIRGPILPISKCISREVFLHSTRAMDGRRTAANLFSPVASTSSGFGTTRSIPWIFWVATSGSLHLHQTVIPTMNMHSTVQMEKALCG